MGQNNSFFAKIMGHDILCGFFLLALKDVPERAFGESSAKATTSKSGQQFKSPFGRVTPQSLEISLSQMCGLINVCCFTNACGSINKNN